ncbi:MAG: SUMF1/EgtB/PvdO family nonheme iron enzyme, partial [Delftia sp.]|nr:SUMF1/EgtB/PvdO family nonheme iron enzyme [Delftia sp.]
VRQHVEDFFSERKRDDLLLCYFSGHGIKDEDGRLYFATPDTRRKRLRSTAIAATLVNDVMRSSRSRRQVLLLDCCYSGAFARGMIAKSDQGVGIKERFEGRGRVVLTASDAMQYAFEGDAIEGQGARSLFTRAVVDGLQTGQADLDGDGYVSLDELYEYAHERVVDETPQQRPAKWAFGVQGQIVIARNPHWVAKPAGLPPELIQAVESPFAGLREGAVRELERLLRGSDEDQAQAAREALERLADDDSRLVSAAAAGALDTPDPVSPEPRRAAPVIQTPVQRETQPTKIARQAFEPEMILIPAGEFLMGSDPKKDKQAYDSEQPQHTLHLPDFYLAKTPVTNAQYAAFVQAAGHDRPQHWKDGRPPGGKENHPVVNVSWNDAIAYCRWLSEATGQPYALPSEAEWEKGARGSDGRIYPWGDQWDAKLCNSREGGKKDTTPGGIYSQGASPYGLLDMAGNVWEWTRSLWQDYPYQADDGREDLTVSSYRVLRGGAWGDAAYDARSAYRYRYI